MKNPAYTLLEVANTHGGDPEKVIQLIQEFEDVQENVGIKFQVLKDDRIALPDYSWFDVYTKLCFSEEDWGRLITEAQKTKEVWLDLFDSYGTEILGKYLDQITGIKLQASVLQNLEIRKGLQQLDVSSLKLILNVAAMEEDEVESILQAFEGQFGFKEIILQVGFQAYPTELADSGLGKIPKLQDLTGKTIAFADHVDAQSEDAVWLPVMAAMQGAGIVEKHIRSSHYEPEYDGFSSVGKTQILKIREQLGRYGHLLQEPFINEREQNYLKTTLQIPVLENSKDSGDLVDLDRDLKYRRTGQEGISRKDIQEHQAKGEILAKDLDADSTLSNDVWRKAKVGVIVACRLKSSRLKRKAVEKIGQWPSVEYCLKNALRFKGVDEVVLATSTADEDAELENHTYSDEVHFFKGHPDDVIQRFLDAAEQHSIDVIIRVTADMPYISDEILQPLLKKHFETGADYTVGKDAAVGTNLEIINTSALKRVRKHFPFAEYSEYMTWYFQNNPEHFNLQFVELPADLVRHYRLTLDYPEDLDMFNAIEERFAEHPEFSLRELIDFLDRTPEVAQINAHCALVYKTDQSLIDTLNQKTRISVHE
ncbi:N-acetylneuraminate synthase family protein [bacterium SCSIO 12741]|nr:N-acetylneuraminate synthase family protein [bacterium SCSIO 12741]